MFRINIFPMRITSIVLIMVLCNHVLLFSATASTGDDWYHNNLGKNQVVLPGYDHISSIESGIKIGERSYLWVNNPLPNSIVVNGESLVNDMLLVGISGNPIEISSLKRTIYNVQDSGAIIEYTGEIKNTSFKIRSVVEYDGNIDFDIEFTPREGEILNPISLRIDISKNSNSKVIVFDTSNIRQQKKRNDMLTGNYKGQFLNAIGVADGNKSLWAYSDNAINRIIKNDVETEVTNKDDVISITQHLIDSRVKHDRGIKVFYSLLATPVRETEAVWRKERIMWGNPGPVEFKKNSKFKLWWPGGLAYDAFPFVKYPPGIEEKLSDHDLEHYKGWKINKKLIERDKEKYNATWLPYFSAHVLSKLDPVLNKYEEQWRIKPDKTFKDGVGYTNEFHKPVLTHSADDYSDYLLYRFNEIIKTIGIEGVYLDHGPVYDSNNMHNGGWYDYKGRLRSSLDISGTRTFLKRLRTLFHDHGKPGYIFIHNSNREIIPAYTFAYGTIDGEQYRRSLVNGDYLKILTLDEFQLRFSNKQYGVINYWLPVEWANHTGNRKIWYGSDQQLMSYRKAQGLALLHDVPIWPQGSHREERIKILNILDDFKYAGSDFSGYWEQEENYNTYPFKISSYKNNDVELLIILNEAESRKEYLIRKKELCKSIHCTIVDVESTVTSELNNQDKIIINSHDFRMIKLVYQDD